MIRKDGAGKRIFTFLCACLCLFVLGSEIRAETYVFRAEDCSAGTERAWDRFREALPPSAAEAVDGVDLADPAGTIAVLRDRTDPGRIFSWLREAFGNALRTVIPAAAPLAGLILLAAAVKTAVPSGPTADAFGRVVRLAAAASVWGLAADALRLARDAAGTLCSLAELLVPVAEGICLLGGGVTESRVARVGMMLALTVVEEIAGRILVPASSALLGLTAVGSSGGFAASFAAGLRKMILRAWQILTLSAAFLLGTQSSLARSADSLGMRWTKFALSSFVPVAGGALSEAWGAMSAGVRFLRGAGGIGGILALTAAAVPAAAPLLLWQWTFGLGRFAAGALGLTDLEKLLDGARGVTELLSAFVLYGIGIFVVALALFAGIGR